MLKNLNKWGRKTTSYIELKNKKCKFENCKNKIFISSLDLNYFKKIIPNTFLKQPITEKFSKVHNIDSEIRWFNESTHYLSIPIIIRKNYVLKEYIGTTKKQGALNGPDFILENINNKKTLGLEVVELNPVLFIFSKNLFKIFLIKLK